MSLAPGTRVGVHEVISLLGAGGMGEVTARATAGCSATAPPQIQVVQNWTEELKRRVPTR